MAYGNYNNRGNNSYGNYGNRQGNGNYNQQQYQPKQPAKPFNLDEFINERLDMYDAFCEAIAARGKEPSDFAFYLGGWITSAVMKSEGK